MNFTIIGAGALGTILGAHLLRKGHGVNLVARGGRAQQLRDEGIRLKGLVKDQLRCSVVDDPRLISQCDVLIFAVKTYQLNSAIESMSHVRAARTFSVANGVMKNAQLASAYGETQTLGCMADTSGELHSNGMVEFTRNVCMHIGSLENTHDAVAAKIAEHINEAGVTTRCVANITTIEWSKYVGWVALFTLALISRKSTGYFLSDANFVAIAVRIIKEMGLIASTKGIPLIDQSPLPVARIIDQPMTGAIETIQRVGYGLTEAVPNHRMSVLQDLEAGRSLEVEETLGYAVRLAEKLGIETPTTELAYRIALGIDALQPTV